MADDILKILKRHPCLGGPTNPTGGCWIESAVAEIESYRQAIWDAYAIMGGDNDGDPSHKHVSFPGSDWPDFLRELATEWRKDYDDALNGV